MSQEITNELLEIEKEIFRSKERIERLETYIEDKWKEAYKVKQRFLESWETFNDRSNDAHMSAGRFDEQKSKEVREEQEKINNLEERKKLLNEALYAGLDESEDF